MIKEWQYNRCYITIIKYSGVYKERLSGKSGRHVSKEFGYYPKIYRGQEDFFFNCRQVITESAFYFLDKFPISCKECLGKVRLVVIFDIMPIKVKLK